MSTTLQLQKQIAFLKNQMFSMDIFGDAHDDLFDVYCNFIHTITIDNKNEKLCKLVKMFTADDLFYGMDEEEMKIYTIIENIKNM
jgi:hypothetical protein